MWHPCPNDVSNDRNRDTRRHGNSRNPHARYDRNPDRRYHANRDRNFDTNNHRRDNALGDRRGDANHDGDSVPSLSHPSASNDTDQHVYDACQSDRPRDRDRHSYPGCSQRNGEHDPDTGYRHAHSIAMPTHAMSFAAGHASRNRRADNHPDGNDGDTFSDRHSIVYCYHPYSWRDTLPNWKWYGRVVGQRLRQVAQWGERRRNRDHACHRRDAHPSVPAKTPCGGR